MAEDTNEDAGSARGRRLTRTPGRAAESRRLALRTGAHPRGRTSIVGRELLGPTERRGERYPSPPSVPSGNRGCRRLRESTKEEGGDAPRSSVIGAPENGQEPEARRNERRGPTLEATERRWRR
ncbi:hypothetical protein NDU88_003481 [Pleurodeles waltl]|uniref:Uncharacterized protein n=1 Tax=Pleurodeles waltl TaxID=8319 RepID=A0AAV7W5P9_PLEWA|nr:hypothetical protein NDU88_003481 [Pleurodeles waltl]